MSIKDRKMHEQKGISIKTKKFKMQNSDKIKEYNTWTEKEKN